MSASSLTLALLVFMRTSLTELDARSSVPGSSNAYDFKSSDTFPLSGLHGCLV
jgi:hypothetical protein